jgi:hypothetical protein
VAAEALRGLVVGLPGYLAFCLTAAFAAPLVGTVAAVPLAFAGCLATCRVTWRRIGPVDPRYR